MGPNVLTNVDIEKILNNISSRIGVVLQSLSQSFVLKVDAKVVINKVV